MKKQLSFLFIMLMSSNVVQASTQGYFTLGASAGYVEREGNFELVVTAANNGLTVARVNRIMEDTGWYGGLVAGYEVKSLRWIYAFDVNLDKQDVSDTTLFNFADFQGNSIGGTERYDRQWILGFSGRIGYQINSYLIPYGRFGIETSEDRLRFTTRPSPQEDDIIEAIAENRVWRWFLGVGVETPLPQVLTGLALRFEYDYHHRGNATSDTEYRENGNNSAFFHIAMRPHVHTTFLTLVYHFTV